MAGAEGGTTHRVGRATRSSRAAVREQNHLGFAFNVGNDSGAAAGPGAGRSCASAWKTLLRCAPHDDICGCSVDATHEDAENRTKRVCEIASLLASDAALRIAQAVKPPRGRHLAQLFVLNGLAFARPAALETTALLPTNSTKLRLVDERGRPVPATISAKVVAPHFPALELRLLRRLPEKAVQAEIAFTADLPALGYRTFFIQEGAWERPPRAVRRLAAGMENEFVRVKLHADGTLDLKDRRTGASYRGLNALRDRGTRGICITSVLLEEGAVTAASATGDLRGPRISPRPGDVCE